MTGTWVRVALTQNRQRKFFPVLFLGLMAVTRVASAVELISINPSNKAGNALSSGPIANTDGNLVAFYSDATDLVRGDVNQVRDVFLRNRLAGTTEIISVNSAGEQANAASHAQGDAPAINGSGTLVGFYSDATNLVGGDFNERTDVFVRNVAAHTTEIVSLSSNGGQGNGPSLHPSMDASGNLVAFQSLASNLTAGDTNGVSDIFVRDRAGLRTERICDSIQGNSSSFAPAISADGNVVAFTSAANNLVAGDTNQKLDVFVCDRRTGAIELISSSSAGVIGDDDSILPDISADGRFVVYKSLARNLVPNDHNDTIDVFFRDRLQGITERVSVNFFGGDSNEGSFPPSISDNGRFVAFGSAASNLVRDDLNEVPSVFVRDMTIGISLLVDLTDDGEQANGGTPDVPPAISGDGRQIGFVSFATNLNLNDSNDTADVYIKRNPFFCDDENPCPAPLICVDGMCVEPGGTKTPTPTKTGTPTATNTAGPNDCCQCTANACEQPNASGCRAECDIVTNAVCLESVRCATFTPTPTPSPTVTSTPTNTAGPNDCCQCTTNACEPPSATGCRADCTIVTNAVCLASTNCATVTPSHTADLRTHTPTVTPTGTLAMTLTPTPQMTGTMTSTRTIPPSFTPTNVATATRTATMTVSATPTVKKLDKDACQCAVSSDGPQSWNGGLMWLSGLAALLWRQRRRTLLG